MQKLFFFKHDHAVIRFLIILELMKHCWNLFCAWQSSRTCFFQFPFLLNKGSALNICLSLCKSFQQPFASCWALDDGPFVCRISRGDRGNLFILKMADPSYRVPLKCNSSETWFLKQSLRILVKFVHSSVCPIKKRARKFECAGELDHGCQTRFGLMN